MKRRLTTLSIATVTSAVLLTSGCISGSGGGSGGDAPQTAAPGEKVALTFSSYAFQDLTVKATQNIVDTYQAIGGDSLLEGTPVCQPLPGDVSPANANLAVQCRPGASYARETSGR